MATPTQAWMSRLPFQVQQSLQGRRGRTPELPPMSEQEERDLLGSVMGGVQYIGETLDKPGRAARGILDWMGGGRSDPGNALMNLIPFSDTVGWTDPDKATSGRDLLTTYFGAPKNKEGMEDWGYDLAGFGAEVLTDPLLLVNIGGLTSKGLKVARGFEKAATTSDDFMEAAGQFARAQKGEAPIGKVMGKTRAERVAEVASGDRALLNIGLPFMDPMLSLGTGNTAAKISKALAYNPVARVLHGLFDPVTDNLYSTQKQWIAETAWTEAQNGIHNLQNFSSAFRSRMADLLGQYDDIAKHHAELGDEKAALTFIRDMAEKPMVNGVDQAGKPILRQLTKDEIQQELLGLMKGNPNAPANIAAKVDKISQQTHELVSTIHDMMDSEYEDAIRLGLNGSWLDEMYGLHVYRSPANRHLAHEVAKNNKELLSGSFKGALHRLPLYKNFPGRTRNIERVVTDPRIGAFSKAADKDMLMDGVRTHLDGLGIQNRRLNDAAIKQQILNLDPQYVAKGKKRADLIADLNALEVAAGLKATAADGMSDLAARVQYTFTKYVDPELKTALAEGLIDQTKYDDEVFRFLGGTVDDARVKEAAVALEAAKKAGTLSDDAYQTALSKMETVKQGELTELVKHFAGFPKEVLDQGFFARSVADDTLDYMEALMQSKSNLLGIHHYLSHPEILRPVSAVQPGEQVVPLSEAWQDISITQTGVKKHRVFNEDGVNAIVQRYIDEHPDLAGKQVADVIGDLTVPEAAVRHLKARVEAMNPKNVSEFAKAFDKTLAVYKGWLTTPFAAFHGRNLLAGAWQSWADGDIPFHRLIGGYYKALQHLRWTISKGAKGKQSEHFQAMLDTRILDGKGFMADVGSEEAAKQLAGTGIAGPELFSRKGIKEAYETSGRNLFNPLVMRGGFEQLSPEDLLKTGGRQPSNLAAQVGDKMYNMTEFMNRGAPFIALLEMGFTPAEAAWRVQRSQFNYAQASSFVKNAGRRAVPFIQWGVNNIPYQIKKIIANPGGRTAQTVRAMNAPAQGDEGYVPRFLRESLAFKVREDEEGNATFVKQAGIPVEDLNRFVVEKGMPSGRTVEKLASMGHPLAIALYESLSGENLYFGKPTKDLASPTEVLTGQFMDDPIRSPSLDFLLMKSPFSRAINEYGMGAADVIGKDARKTPRESAMNFATGLRFGTYNLPKQKLLEQRQRLNEEVAKDPLVRTLAQPYIPKKDVAKVSPRTVELLKRAQSMSRALKKLRDMEDAKAMMEGRK